MIMIPMLILQIFLFPLTANWFMDNWVNSRRTLSLQETASHLGSTMQQVYFLLNHKTTPIGNVTQRSDVPPFIDNYPYTGNATLRSVTDPVLDPTGNSSRVLELTLWLGILGTKASTLVLMGQNVMWKNSTFVSNSRDACIMAGKLANGTIWLSFEVTGA